MTWAVALNAGIGLGLLHFGGLWFTVRRAAQRPWLLAAGSAGRLILTGLVLGGLAWQGAVPLLAALAGLWLARACVVLGVGGLRHG